MEDVVIAENVVSEKFRCSGLWGGGKVIAIQGDNYVWDAYNYNGYGILPVIFPACKIVVCMI